MAAAQPGSVVCLVGDYYHPCVLQPAVWPRDRKVGAQGIRGVAERDKGCSADPGQDGHQLFSRVHIRPRGNPMGAGAAAV